MTKLEGPDRNAHRITISVAEAAMMVGVCESTIRNAIRAKELTSYLVRRRRLVLVGDLFAWLTRKQNHPQLEDSVSQDFIHIET